MKTLFERVSPDLSVAEARGIDRDLAQAKEELAHWQARSEVELVELAGILTVDARVRWNLDFCRRRVDALERARRDMLAAEGRP